MTSVPDHVFYQHVCGFAPASSIRVVRAVSRLACEKVWPLVLAARCAKRPTNCCRCVVGGCGKSVVGGENYVDLTFMDTNGRVIPYSNDYRACFYCIACMMEILGG
jgi:hypothetical protein